MVRALASSSADGAIKFGRLRRVSALKQCDHARLYEGMNIAGATGLTEAQKAITSVGSS